MYRDGKYNTIHVYSNTHEVYIVNVPHIKIKKTCLSWFSRIIQNLSCYKEKKDMRYIIKIMLIEFPNVVEFPSFNLLSTHSDMWLIITKLYYIIHVIYTTLTSQQCFNEESDLLLYGWNYTYIQIMVTTYSAKQTGPM